MAPAKQDREHQGSLLQATFKSQSLHLPDLSFRLRKHKFSFLFSFFHDFQVVVLSLFFCCFLNLWDLKPYVPGDSTRFNDLSKGAAPRAITNFSLGMACKTTPSFNQCKKREVCENAQSLHLNNYLFINISKSQLFASENTFKNTQIKVSSLFFQSGVYTKLQQHNVPDF